MRILHPAVIELKQKGLITQNEFQILSKAVEIKYFAKKDIMSDIKDIKEVQISRTISSLRDRGLLVPLKENARKYVIGFGKGPMLREVIKRLGAEGFLPIKEDL